MWSKSVVESDISRHFATRLINEYGSHNWVRRPEKGPIYPEIPGWDNFYCSACVEQQHESKAIFKTKDRMLNSQVFCWNSMHYLP